MMLLDRLLLPVLPELMLVLYVEDSRGAALASAGKEIVLWRVSEELMNRRVKAREGAATFISRATSDKFGEAYMDSPETRKPRALPLMMMLKADRYGTRDEKQMTARPRRT